MSEKGIGFNLKIVGDGPAMGTLQDHLATEIREKKVELMGWLNNEEVLNILKHSEIFVLTSSFEGFCIALLEAMANGCCPVVTNIRSGNKQLIRDSANGFINEIGDIEAFVDRLNFLYENRSILFKMRTEAWLTGKEYSLSKMVENYDRCFANAVKTAKLISRKMDPDFPIMESCRSVFPLWLRRLKGLIKT
jgi:glycosyltransferase involved in cell wall biosynthesis